MPEVRLIDANVLHAKIFEENRRNYAATETVAQILLRIETAPTIEPEVQHAYWEPSEVGEYHCTNCGVECDVDKFHKALLNPFCGKCGAKMK